jgi:4-hydroxybenzoate polyprenyltransferase
VTFGLALRLGRVSNLPTVWSNTIAGAVLGGAAISSESLFLLGVATSLFYIGGMYLNDAFDREIDATERPERPIPSGQVAAGAVFGAGFGMLAGGIAVALLAAQRSSAAALAVGVVGIALAAAIIAYNMAHKGVAFAPLVMGACRALVYILAAVAAGGTVSGAVLIPSLSLLGYVAGLTYVAAQENLREVKNLWPLLLLAAPVLAAITTRPEGWAVPLFVLAFLAWVTSAVLLIAGSGEKNVRGAVTRLIAGISLVDAIAIACTGSTELAAIAAGGLLLTHLLQKVVPGT